MRRAALASLALLAAPDARADPAISSAVSPACRAAAGTLDVAPDALQREVGQMVMVGLEGRSAANATVRRARDMIGRGDLGGVLLLGRNLGSRAQTRSLIATLKPRGAAPLPFIAVDHEGGRVQRLREAQGATRLPSAARVARMGEAEATRLYAQAARELARAGVNVNFGPVVDLAREPRNRVIVGLGRAFGRDPARVVRMARAFLRGHREAGVLVALKHFPGHGSSLADSHEGFTDITRSWSPEELVPYRELAASADMVMTGHLYHASLPGAGGHPVSLAPGTIDAVLRGTIGFRGVVVTDDLDMGAITTRYGFEEAIVLAANAGNDVLLFSSATRPGGYVAELARDALCRGLADGRIPYARVLDANRRIAALKRRLGA